MTVSINSIITGGAYHPVTGGSLTGTTTITDDAVLSFGGVVGFLWETQDADANELLIDLPTGGAVDVPVIVIGQGVTGVDLGLYNGVVDPRIAIFGIGAVTTAPIWEFRKARGTIAVPTIITSGDDLGSINFYGYSGSTGYHLSAAIEVDSTGTIGPTGTVRVPSVMRLRTSTDAAPSVLTTRLTIDSAGLSTFAGDVSLGTNKLKLTDHLIKQEDATFVSIRNIADSAYSNLKVGAVYPHDNFAFQVNGIGILAYGSTDGYSVFDVYDTGVGYVEIARMQGAADPYWQQGRDDTGVALSAVTIHQVWQAGGGTGNEAAGFGYGLAIKIGNAASEVETRASWDTVLQTATNGSEDASFIFKAMVAGSIATVLSFGGYAGVSKLGFYATAPVALQTGVAVTAAGVHAALVNLGLITA